MTPVLHHPALRPLRKVNSPSHPLKNRPPVAITDHASRFTPHVSRITHPLHRIQNWPQLAHDAKYSVKALAGTCGVSVRVLERFFLAALRSKPRQWLKRQRMLRAAELLAGGNNVNQTADCLGYHDRSHFSREFKKYYGLAPKQHAGRPLNTAPKPKMSHSATNLPHLATYV
jgi:AraC-like DNA-binding protein